MNTVEIRRPNGKLYRARKPPEVTTYQDWRDDVTCGLVLRTHDVELALQLAADLIAELELVPANASTHWWRLAPFKNGSGYDRNWIDDPVRGVPCVVIPYE